LYKPDVPKTTTTELLLIPMEVSNIRKITTTESLSISSEMPDTSDKPTVNNTSKQTQKMFFKLRLIYCLYVLFFLQILALLIYLWIFVRKKLPVNNIENRYHQGRSFKIENINIRKEKKFVIIFQMYIF
jgi:hypothetical protein